MTGQVGLGGGVEGGEQHPHQPVLALSAQGRERYRGEQIHGVRARDVITHVEVPGIWVGRLVLENLDAAGEPVGQEHNAYQVVTDPDGTRRIAVSTPLDSYSVEKIAAVDQSRPPGTSNPWSKAVTSTGAPLQGDY